MSRYKIALLGIDGAGKSTISIELKRIFEAKGFRVKIIPFHKWIFADILRNIFGNILDKDRKGKTTPYSPKKNSLSSYIKPPIAFIDNIIYYLINSPTGKNKIYIYDRFICATQIKFKALNYHVNWFRFLWWNIIPDFAFILDINVDESIKRQIRRKDKYIWHKEQLCIEQNEYVQYAKKHNYPIIANQSKSDTIKTITEILEKRFSNENNNRH